VRLVIKLLRIKLLTSQTDYLAPPTGRIEKITNLIDNESPGFLIDDSEAVAADEENGFNRLLLVVLLVVDL